MAFIASSIYLLTLALVMVTGASDPTATSPTGATPAVTSAASVVPVTEPAEETLDSESETSEAGPAATVSCQDEVHCHCTLRNGTVDIQCRYGDQVRQPLHDPAEGQQQLKTLLNCKSEGRTPIKNRGCHVCKLLLSSGIVRS